MLVKLGSLIAAIAFPLLCLNCISGHAPEIAATLRGMVSAGLQSVSINGVDVKADGRDITLTGKVPTEDTKDKAGQVARLLPGVRTVDNQLVVVGDVKAVQTELDKILLDKKIEFESGKSVILATSTPVLQEVLDVLNKAPQLSVTVNGHTDNSGDADANRELSQARAQAVVQWLTQKGIAAARMKSAGFGPDKPIAPNTTPEGRAKNRRVEIIANQ
jgi:OmpA-OmpF porin, OOP family